jgi:hypothetical protein
MVGFLSGIYAGYYFGYVLGSLGVLSLIGVPFGKALTGLTAGFLYKKLNRNQRSSLTIPLTLVSYIPECIYTIVYFLNVVPFVYPFMSFMTAMVPIVIPKAWIEISIMSILMGALVGNLGFREFISRFFYTPKLEKSYGKK